MSKLSQYVITVSVNILNKYIAWLMGEVCQTSATINHINSGVNPEPSLYGTHNHKKGAEPNERLMYDFSELVDYVTTSQNPWFYKLTMMHRNGSGSTKSKQTLQMFTWAEMPVHKV